MAFSTPDPIVQKLSKPKESESLIEQIHKNTEYDNLAQKSKDRTITPDEQDLLDEYEEKLLTLQEIGKTEDESAAANQFVAGVKQQLSSPAMKALKQKIDNGEATNSEILNYNKLLYRQNIAQTLIENLGDK